MHLNDTDFVIRQKTTHVAPSDDDGSDNDTPLASSKPKVPDTPYVKDQMTFSA